MLFFVNLTTLSHFVFIEVCCNSRGIFFKNAALIDHCFIAIMGNNFGLDLTERL